LGSCSGANPVDGVKKGQWVTQKLTISYGATTIEYEMLCAPIVVSGQGDGSILDGGSGRTTSKLLAMAPFPSWVFFDIPDGHLLVKLACENQLTKDAGLGILKNKYQQGAFSEMFVVDNLHAPKKVTKIWPVEFNEKQNTEYHSHPISNGIDAQAVRWKVLKDSEPMILMDYSPPITVPNPRKNELLTRASHDINKLESISWVYKRVNDGQEPFMKVPKIPPAVNAAGIKVVYGFFQRKEEPIVKQYWEVNKGAKNE